MTGRRPGRPTDAVLDRRRVLDEAMALTREVGLDGVSVRQLATRLGVRPASVYHHLGHLDDIRRAVSDAAIEGLVIPDRDGADWKAWLRSFFTDLHRVASEHPGTGAYVRTHGGTSARHTEMVGRVVGVLLDAGFPPEEAARSFWVLMTFALDVIDMADRSATKAPERPEDPAAWAASLPDSIDPGLAAALPTFVTTTGEQLFAHGIELILDGLEQRRSSY